MARRAITACLASALLSSLSLTGAPARKSPAFDLTIVNSTAHELVRTELTLPAGKWCGEPREQIKAGESASFCAEGANIAEGSVTYRIGETGATVTLNFNVDQGSVSHSQSAAFSNGSFRAKIAGTDDCGRNWRGTPHCICNYTFTITPNR